MPDSNSARFALLVSSMGLSANAITLLAVIARHRNHEDPEYKELVSRLAGPAREVADRLTRGETDGAQEDEVGQMAHLLSLWGSPSTH